MGGIEKAYGIAENCLKACYTDKATLAGKSLWFDYWARDSFFASWGSLELKDYEQVRKNLLFFIKYQRKKGQIPLRVDKFPLILKLIGIKLNRGLKPRYLEDKIQSYPRDQNSLFIITALKYIEKTKDKKFARNHFNSLEKAVKWNLSKDRDRDFLVEENYYATWADSLRKKGKVLYTNVLHCEAIKCFSTICRLLDKKEESKKYLELHKDIKQQINNVFWNGKYYADWQDRKRQDFFSSDGNILAVIFEIADIKKSESIFRFIEKNSMETFSLKTNFPKYKFLNISMTLRLAGIPDYHNGMVWLWVGCIDALAKIKTGKRKEAKALLEKIAGKINEYGSVYEVYEKRGKPVNRWFFKSEKEFAWSSGLFILAVSELNRRNK